MKTITIKKSRPNGFFICLKQAGEGEDAFFFVIENDDTDGVEFDGDRAAAEAYFDKRVAELADTPNWDLQERYDEIHGTVNGYAPWQFSREY